MLRKILLFTFIVTISSIAISCQKKNNQQIPATPLVIVSIPPYVTIIQKIASDTVTVKSAISPGYNPHISEITPKQMQLMQHADLWIGVGEPYEKALLRSLKEMNQKIISLQMNKKTLI